MDVKTNTTYNRDQIKIIYVLLDGVGDLPNPQINNLTPLEAACTPNMDKLSMNGVMGQVISVGRGIAPQSDIAVFNMLGYNFKNEKYVGRGIVESIGSNIDFKEGDLALRGNFATIDERSKVIDRRAGRIISNDETKLLCNTINEKIRFKDKNVSVVVVPTIAHRVTIRFRHNTMKLSENITNTDPAYDKINGIGVAKDTSSDIYVGTSIPQDDTYESRETANIINEFTNQLYSLLDSHPVNDARRSIGRPSINTILCRDAGNTFPNYLPIRQKYNLDVASIVDMPVEIGISRILSMDAIFAGDINAYEEKAKKAAENLTKYDLIYVHLKGPDEFGHDGDPIGKKNNLEDIDNRFFGTLLQYIRTNDTTIVISGDHSTPCIKKSHSDDPIPLLVSGEYIPKDGSKRFTESYAKAGKLGLIMGSDVISTSINLINGKRRV